MMRAVKVGLVAALIAAIPATALANVSVERTRSSLRTLGDRVKTTRLAIQKTRADQATLEHRITALKRLAATNRLSARTELERLLRESVQADATLAERRSAAERAQTEFARWAQETTRSIDAEMKRRLPDIKRGSLASRKNAARRINTLRALRASIDTEIRRTPAAPSSATWAKYVDVKIEALDGPAELAEKADFLEDTRDKYDRKRRAILDLIENAKREADVRRAANEFRADREIFDDESRSVRVPRTAAASNLSRSAGDQASVAEAPQSPPPNATAFEGTQRDSDPNASPTNLAGAESPTDAVQDAPPSLPPPAPAPSKTTAGGPAASLGTSDGPIVRGVDAQALIGLGTEELGNKNLDPATLQRLLEELYELDTHLAAQAKKMRERARALESDEARATDMK